MIGPPDATDRVMTSPPHGGNLGLYGGVIQGALPTASPQEVGPRRRRKLVARRTKIVFSTGRRRRRSKTRYLHSRTGWQPYHAPRIYRYVLAMVSGWPFPIVTLNPKIARFEYLRHQDMTLDDAIPKGFAVFRCVEEQPSICRRVLGNPSVFEFRTSAECSAPHHRKGMFTTRRILLQYGFELNPLRRPLARAVSEDQRLYHLAEHK